MKKTYDENGWVWGIQGHDVRDVEVSVGRTGYLDRGIGRSRWWV